MLYFIYFTYSLCTILSERGDHNNKIILHAFR